MDGLMMDFQLTLPPLLRRAETYFPDKQITTRLPDKSFHRYTYRDCTRRSRQLAVALKKLGLERGDRVATLAWNHFQHMECYLGIPCGGFVLHTLNLRLHPSDLAYIATHAGDKAVIVDRQLLPLLDQFKEDTPIEHVFVVEDSYEELLATADPDEWEDPKLDENEAAAMCYTSGTTGMPKGVVWRHEDVFMALGGGAFQRQMHFLERDVFHVQLLGHGDDLIELEIPQRIRSDADLQFAERIAFGFGDCS
jgi:fatty-acyl-CoA synthase